MKKEEKLTVYLESTNLKTLEKLAKKEGFSKSAMARNILLKELKHVQKSDYVEEIEA